VHRRSAVVDEPILSDAHFAAIREFVSRSRQSGSSSGCGNLLAALAFRPEHDGHRGVLEPARNAGADRLDVALDIAHALVGVEAVRMLAVVTREAIGSMITDHSCSASKRLSDNDNGMKMLPNSLVKKSFACEAISGEFSLFSECRHRFQSQPLMPA
jgi:hypothetical protein